MVVFPVSSKSWLQPVLDELANSSFPQAAHLRKWIKEALPTFKLNRHDDLRAQLDAMEFEEAWAGSVLHDEFMEWPTRGMHGGGYFV